MVSFFRKRTAVALLIGMLMSGTAYADPIPGLYNTGIDAGGQKLPGNGETDSHYRVNGQPAVTYYNGAYFLTSDSQWIGQFPGGTYSQPLENGSAKTYYTLTIDLTGLNPATARISGSWGVDNYGIAYINGQQFSVNSIGFSSLTGFTINSGFKEGINVITFMVEDYGPPAAFVVSGLTGTADKASPPAWQTDDWGAWSTTCGQATRSRTVSCYNPDNGAKLADSMCAAPKPETTQSQFRTEGCTYDWESQPYGAVAPACGPSIQTRSVSCVRSDRTTVADTNCTKAKPATEQTVNDYQTCTYQWGVDVWSALSSTCGAATETRGVYCQRSDGTKVPDTQCAAGSRPETTRSSYQTSGCTFSWQTPGEWSTPIPACGPTIQTRTVNCARSDGQPADESSCPTATKPETQRASTSYATCGYSWEAGEWTSPTRTCGTSTRTRTVTCLRTDGTTVEDARCEATRPASSETLTDYEACTRTWEYSVWSEPAAACGASERTRTALCRRQDGQVVADGECPSGREALTQPAQDYSACSFHWDASAWTITPACGDTVRTRNVTCLRQDNTAAPDAQCTAAERPTSSEQVADTSQCNYSWLQTGSTAWSTCTGGTQSRTIELECRRSNGTVADESLCPTPKPATVDTRTCTMPAPPPVIDQPSTPTNPGGTVVFRKKIRADR